MLLLITGFPGLGKVSTHSRTPVLRMLLRATRHGDLHPHATQDR